MVGAWKIDENTDDLERMRQMFDMGLSNSEISRIYRTTKGDTISRTHIKHIREGKKWNPDKRTFLMKTEMTNTTREVQFHLATKADSGKIVLVECDAEKAIHFQGKYSEFNLNKDGSIDIFIFV